MVGTCKHMGIDPLAYRDPPGAYITIGIDMTDQERGHARTNRSAARWDTGAPTPGQ